MSTAQSNTRYSTLGEVNNRLLDLGFNQLSQEDAANITAKVPRKRFIDALDQAQNNQGAKQFLVNLLQSATGNPSPAANDNPTQGQPESPAPAPENNPQEQPAMPGDQQDSGNNSQPSQNAEQGTAPNGGGDAPASTKRTRAKHHVYGGKAALCWEEDVTRADVPTIALDGAKAVAEREYNWNEKIRVQLTRQEIPQVAAVLLGFAKHFKAANHGVGDNKGKGFELEHQGDKVFAKVFSPNGGMCSVPISPEDTFEVAALFIRQIRKAKPWLSGQDAITLIQTTVGRMSQKKQQG